MQPVCILFRVRRLWNYEFYLGVNFLGPETQVLISEPVMPLKYTKCPEIWGNPYFITQSGQESSPRFLTAFLGELKMVAFHLINVCRVILVEIIGKNSMKIVQSKVIMTAKCCSFMN